MKNTMIKHLYRRTITHKGKKIKVWYFWFYDENGKQVRRSCGTNGKPCLTKRDAELFLDKIKDSDLLLKDTDMTLADFATGMFDANSTYIKKLTNKGYSFDNKTLLKKQIALNVFLEKFGDTKIDKLHMGKVDDWLISFEKSNSWRNTILTIINAIYKELSLQGLITKPLTIQYFKRVDQKEKGILFPDEIKMLFPNSREEICRIWKLPKSKFTDDENYMFATLIFTILSTGMRSGEARAITFDQFVRADAILINAMLNEKNERINHLKKGNQKNKKWRLTILPRKTVEMINQINFLNTNKDSFVFTLKGLPLRSETMNKHFKKVCIKNNIDVKARNITIHSLRFTYNTMMNREISGDSLRLMLGHVTQDMTDYYDKSTVTDHLPDLLKNKSAIDSVWT